MRRIRKKIISQKGETLAETLVAALIAALGLLLLASMIMNATHIVEKSQVTMKNFYAGVTEMETKISAEVDEKVPLKIKGEGVSSVIEIDVYTASNGLVTYEKSK